MNPYEKRKVLRSLLNRKDAEPNAFFHGKLVLILLWFPLLVIYAISFHLTQVYQLSPILLCFVSVVVGAIMFWVFLRLTNQRCWPTVKSYIDKDRIELRLHELESK